MDLQHQQHQQETENQNTKNVLLLLLLLLAVMLFRLKGVSSIPIYCSIYISMNTFTVF